MVMVLKDIVIAIDGPAASGKGTLARRLAHDLSLSYLDTGKLYRAVGWHLMRQGSDPEDEQAALQVALHLQVESVCSEHLYDENVGRAASLVSAMPEVRAALLEFQRSYAAKEGGAVLDGRDIGTIVCPDANFKFFITASLESRAKRRYNELISRGEDVTYQGVTDHLVARDTRDQERSVAPLVQANDAIFIDTTDSGPDEVYKKVLSYIV